MILCLFIAHIEVYLKAKKYVYHSIRLLFSKKLRLDITQVSSTFLPYWKSVLVKCLKMIYVFTFDDTGLCKFVPDGLWSWFITVYRSANIFQGICIHSSRVKWMRPGLSPWVFSSPAAIITTREVLVCSISAAQSIQG